MRADPAVPISWATTSSATATAALLMGLALLVPHGAAAAAAARPHDAGSQAASAGLADGPVVGFGKDLPLEDAIPQIVPGSVVVRFADDIDRTRSISWRSGPSWQRVLRASLQGIGADFTPGVAGSIVIVSTATATRPPVAIAPPDAAQPGAEAATATPAAAPAPAPTPAPTPSWEVKEGLTLRRVLEAWCAESGYHLEWPEPQPGGAVYDFPVRAGGQFDGQFDAAVEWLLRGFSTARPRPLGRLRSNGAAHGVLIIYFGEKDMGG